LNRFSLFGPNRYAALTKLRINSGRFCFILPAAIAFMTDNAKAYLSVILDKPLILRSSKADTSREPKTTMPPQAPCAVRAVFCGTFSSGPGMKRHGANQALVGPITCSAERATARPSAASCPAGRRISPYYRSPHQKALASCAKAD
jgi:hypothetical protein